MFINQITSRVKKKNGDVLSGSTLSLQVYSFDQEERVSPSGTSPIYYFLLHRYHE